MHHWISITAGVIITTALAVLLIVGPSAGDPEVLRSTMLEYGPWAPGISIGLMVAQAIIAPLPMNAITITNGLVFGPMWGGVLSWFSTVLGASLCFMLSKKFGKPFAHKIVGSSMSKAEGFFRKYGLQAMFLVRMMPFVPFDAVSYGAPLFGVPFGRFLLATSIGIIPSVFIYSYLGTIIAGFYWWVLLGLLTVALIAVIFTAWAQRSSMKNQPSIKTITPSAS
jgi:uncharacterized membrane protein YdjX (TVP38/TMEM64 family)